MNKESLKIKSKAGKAWLVAAVVITGLSFFTLWWLGLIFIMISVAVDEKKQKND